MRTTRRTSTRTSTARGFTLVELAVVLAIVGLLLGMVLVPLGTQFELRLVREETQNLNLVRDALLGFAATQGRLPCPDTTGDGAEDLVIAPPPPPIICVNFAGELPFATLGLGIGDAWQRHYLYEVDTDFVQTAQSGILPPNANGLDLADAANLTVLHRYPDKATVPVANGGTASGAAVVVVSLGSNGLGGTAVDGDVLPNPDGGTDELDNADQGGSYITRIRTEDQSGGGCNDGPGVGPLCDFDDLLLWLPGDLVRSRLVETGWLP